MLKPQFKRVLTGLFGLPAVGCSAVAAIWCADGAEVGKGQRAMAVSGR